MVWERLTRKQMTSRPCEQYTHKNSTYRFVQHDHISSREHAWLKSCKAQSHIFVSQNNCHPRVMSRSLPHLTLTTSTSSLPFTSPIFPTTSPTHTRPSVHDEYFPCDGPRQGGRSTQIPSLTGYEPKLIEPEDLEPRRIELDRNLGTDPYQVQERFVRDNYQNLSLKIWRDLEKLVSICPMSNHRCIPIMTQRRALQTRILKMENYEKVLASPLYVQGRENCNSSRIPTAPVKLSATIQEREVSAKRTQADRREKLDVKFISGTESIGEICCNVFIGKRRTEKSIQQFHFQKR